MPKIDFKVEMGAISAVVYETGRTSIRRWYRKPDGQGDTTSISFPNKASLVKAIAALNQCSEFLEPDTPDEK